MPLDKKSLIPKNKFLQANKLNKNKQNNKTITNKILLGHLKSLLLKIVGLNKHFQMLFKKSLGKLNKLMIFLMIQISRNRKKFNLKINKNLQIMLI